MQVAIVAFVGVIVGSFITALSQFVLALWKFRRDDKAKRALVKLAARLVHDELNTAHSLIQLSHSTGSWYSDPDLCKTVTWKKYRGDIANALPDAHWLSICDGILAVEIVRDVRSHHFDEPATFLVTLEERDAIENLGPRVYQALSVIGPYAADAGPSRTRRLRTFLTARLRRSKPVASA
jgi:hypothetical protein